MDMNQKLAELRKAKGLTQKELAEALNVTRQAVSRWEVGTAAPSLDNLAYLSRLYGIPLDDLVNVESGGPEPAEETPADAPEAPPAPSAVNTVRPRSALVPLLLAVLILGVGILIGIELRKEPKAEPVERVIVGGMREGWLEKTPADIEDEKRYLEMEADGQVVGHYYPSTGILETLPIDSSEETPTPP